MPDLTNRSSFIGVALIVEGSLIGAAPLLGRLLYIDPYDRFAWSAAAAGQALAATLPALMAFLVLTRAPLGPLKRLREILEQTLGPSLVACRWYDLALIAAVAGFGEELLFRGVLHEALGISWSNALFGLLHAMTPAYCILAALMGAYLGWLLEQTGNLLVPILVHALYDFVAFLVLARSSRQTLR
jgi:hypothetical protein